MKKHAEWSLCQKPLLSWFFSPPLRAFSFGAGGWMLLGFSLLDHTATAAPILPSPEQRIVSLQQTETPALKKSRAAYQNAPKNPIAAANLAMELVTTMKQTQVDNLLREAKEVIQPWSSQARNLPIEFLVTRATIAQQDHHFEEALADLDLALSKQPGHVQALLTRTTVLRLLGRLDESARSIIALQRYADGVVSFTAAADLSSIRGDATAAWHVMQTHVLPYVEKTAKNMQLWIETTAAEVALRAGDRIAAEKHFKNALNISSIDVYSLLGYADYLLAEKRYTEVFALTDRHRANQDLRLRKLLAMQGSNAKAVKISALRQTMEEQFAIERSHTEGRHLRTEARYALEIQGDYEEAFTLAKQNWAEQKEPVDALLLLDAAHSAGQHAYAKTFYAELQRLGYGIAHGNYIDTSKPHSS